MRHYECTDLFHRRRSNTRALSHLTPDSDSTFRSLTWTPEISSSEVEVREHGLNEQNEWRMILVNTVSGNAAVTGVGSYLLVAI